MRLHLLAIILLLIPAAAFAYTMEMTLQASISDIEEYRVGGNAFSADESVDAVYSGAFFTGAGSRNEFLAMAFAGKSLVSASLDNTEGTPVMGMKQGSGSRFVIALSNSSLQGAAADLSSGRVHKSRYGYYTLREQQSLVYLYARIAGAVLSGNIFSSTVIRNRGGDPPLITLERG